MNLCDWSSDVCSSDLAAALGTIQKESGSWAWMAFTAAFQLGVAWLVTFLVYQAGMLIL